MEFLRPSPAMDPLQEVQSHGHLGQGGFFSVCLFFYVCTSTSKACSPEPPPLYVADRSPHSPQCCQIPSVTSAVEVGRSMRSPEAGCHFGPCPSRARYSHTVFQVPSDEFHCLPCYKSLYVTQWIFMGRPSTKTLTLTFLLSFDHLYV